MGHAYEIPWEVLGGAEAEGFGVGVHHEEPTPALRATPLERGSFIVPTIRLQNSGVISGKDNQ
jgi:hypothetical protein